MNFTPLSIKLEEPAWPELTEKDITQAPVDSVAIIPEATTDGRPGVFVRIDVDGGPSGPQVIIGHTTARLFCAAAKAFMAKYPDLFED